MIKAVVGSGGKTSYIRRQADAYRRMGCRVFVTTSTHMDIEADTLLGDDPKKIIDRLENTGYVMAGIQDGNKIKPLSKETYLKVCDHADVVLVEADGSKQMPFKIPNDTEPVIYENVDEIVIVVGLHGLQRPAKEVVHRLELLTKWYPIHEKTVIMAHHVQDMIEKGYIFPLQQQYPKKKITIEPSHDGTLYQRAVARLLQEGKDVSILSKDWFCTQPKMIICGGGHVSCELVKMAASLDFSIKVIDDRPEYATSSRFPGASEVICDSFSNLKQHLEPDAYYVVVTRGHKDDLCCVQTILSSKYRYLGMIGSKIKVKNTFDHLMEAGYLKEQIDTIHAPIGLAIKAVTPAEIAISILAEIIQEKNSRHTASVSKELLETNRSGVLCIIIEKKGSTPRNVGSMMLVTTDKIFDSIGGGPIEYEAICDAKNCDRVMIKEYYLTNEESQGLGMICGGSNKVLFVPIKEKDE